KYLWRYNTRPVEAEVVRDCIFHVAGRLDLTMGGPEIDFPLGLTVPRRSIYFRHAAEKHMEFLQIFDGPSVTECYDRKQSTDPAMRARENLVHVLMNHHEFVTIR